MIEFKLYGVVYTIDFSFFLLWAIIYTLGRQYIVIPTFIACTVHEFGHLILITLSKRTIRSIEFKGTGIKIVPNYDRLLPIYWDLAIMSAGCMFNFILSAVVLCLDITSLKEVAYISLSLGVFNLLPFKSLDGGCIIEYLKSIH